MNIPVDYQIVLREPHVVLRKQLKNENLKIVKFKYEPLTKVGDNYGSTMLKVRVLINKDNTGKKEELNLVAKMLPPTNIQREMFASPYTFKKEIFMYKDLIPTYESIYGKAFDVTPKYYGSRFSLNEDANEIDENAVILMEDLKTKGYYMGDRHKGLDLMHLKVVIKALAKFHAVGLAAKHKIPSFVASLETYSKQITFCGPKLGEFLRQMLDVVKNDSYMNLYLERIISCNGGKTDTLEEITLDPQHPWACVVHKDFWTNNMLFHQDEAGNVDSVKMVDFQTYCILSPLTDLIFFLCTSVSMPLNHLDEMLELYRQEAISILNEIGCDSSLFSKDQFEKRLIEDARIELARILMMIKVVELRCGEDFDMKPNEYCTARLRRVVEIFVEKNWM